MAFRSDRLTPEFKQSIVEHAVTSGRNANCFFQSFFHILTAQNSAVLTAIKQKHESAVSAFVDTFNKVLSLEPAVDFDKIIQISKELHPLERESVFGPILRDTYNAMLKSGLIAGKRKLPFDAIVWGTETAVFSKAFGAEIFVYMDQEEFDRSRQHLPEMPAMPSEVAERVAKTQFKIGDKNFYCDYVSQLKEGEKIFDINIVFGGRHLNYTLGDSKHNSEHRKLIVTEVSLLEGTYADRATHEAEAPLAKPDLSTADLASALCRRFQLTRSEKVEAREEKRSTTAHTAMLLGITPSELQVTAIASQSSEAKESASSINLTMDSADDKINNQKNDKTCFRAKL